MFFAECISVLGTGGLQELPDDVLALVSAAMLPRDVVMLGATCRKLRAVCVADKLWLPHCERILAAARVGEVVDLHSWRKAMNSFQCLWRFIVAVRSLVGLWVHQNPELGNLVYVTWGFVSVVGCRIIPQELGPRGLERGLLWAPVFEIVGNSDGSLAFFLHGRENSSEKETEYCYPGRFYLSDPNPNVLLLEAEPLLRSSLLHHHTSISEMNPDIPPLLAQRIGDGGGDSSPSAEELPVSRRRRRPAKPSSSVVKAFASSAGGGIGGGKGKSSFSGEQEGQIPFHHLGFGDRRRLLELLTPQIALRIPPLCSLLFPCPSRRGPACDLINRDDDDCTKRLQEQEAQLRCQDSCHKDLHCLADRRTRLIHLHNCGMSERTNLESATRDYGGRGNSSGSRSGGNGSLRPYCCSRGVDSEGLRRSLCITSASQHQSQSSRGSAKLLKAKAKAKAAAARGTSLENGENRVVDASVPPQHLPVSITNRKLGTLKKLGLAGFVVSTMKKMVGKNPQQGSGAAGGISGKGKLGMGVDGSTSNAEAKRLQLQEFLKQSKSVGLRLHATSWSLHFYRAWPIMHNNQFALYKIPEQQPCEGMDYAGVWGGTFGWPPGRPIQDKPGKALFFLKISYEQTFEGRLLIATKILEGTQYVVHPNGSAMFTAKIDEPSSAIFPWDKDEDGRPVDILHVFQGEGIASGYGFRYPGSKPGNLFIDSAGNLAFVWRESRTVLALTRLDLQTSLENGERVAALPPVANFAYLTAARSSVNHVQS